MSYNIFQKINNDILDLQNKNNYNKNNYNKNNYNKNNYNNFIFIMIGTLLIIFFIYKKR
jgi:hypothetical protein